MEITPALILQMAMYLISFGSLGSLILTKLNALEKKVEKHNNVIERLYVAEESVRSAHHRIDELRGEIKR